MTSSSRRSSSRPRFDAIFRNCTLMSFGFVPLGYGFFSYKIQNCSNVNETTKYERRTYELKVETETFRLGSISCFCLCLPRYGPSMLCRDGYASRQNFVAKNLPNHVDTKAIQNRIQIPKWQAKP